jgi:hypothetical protein
MLLLIEVESHQLLKLDNAGHRCTRQGIQLAKQLTSRRADGWLTSNAQRRVNPFALIYDF